MQKKFILTFLLLLIFLNNITSASNSLSLDKLPEDAIGYSLEFLSGDDKNLNYLSRFYSITPRSAESISKSLVEFVLQWPKNKPEVLKAKEILEKYYNTFNILTPGGSPNISKDLISCYLSDILSKNKYQLYLASLDIENLAFDLNQDFKSKIEQAYSIYISNPDCFNAMSLNQLLLIYYQCLNCANILESFCEIAESGKLANASNMLTDNMPVFKFYILLSSIILSFKQPDERFILFVLLYFIGKVIKDLEHRFNYSSYLNSVFIQSNLFKLQDYSTCLEVHISVILRDRLKKEINKAINIHDKDRIEDLKKFLEPIKNSYLIVFNFFCYADNKSKKILKNYIFDRNKKSSILAKDLNIEEDIKSMAKKYKFSSKGLLKELLYWAEIWNISI